MLKNINTMVILVIIIILSTVLIGFFYNQSNSSLPLSDNTFHPTIIHWLKDKEDCERTNREWNDTEHHCLDYKHDPNF